jgi:TatD DNase family protein
MIDTHCHLTFPQLNGDLLNVLRKAQDVGVMGMITIATTSEGSLENLEIAKSHDNIWCSAGVHPLYADEPIDWAQVKAAGEDDLCVAWGELGLDGYHPKPSIDVQREVLRTQLRHLEKWSHEGLEKPIVIHCRDAYDMLLPELEASSLPRDRYVFHCFTGTPDEAEQVLEFGAMISFTGVVTYRNATAVAEAAKIVPEDRIMVETDAPYLSPEPLRGTHPNEPANVMHTARFLAKLRGCPEKEFERTLDENACRFFGINLKKTRPVGDPN